VEEDRLFKALSDRTRRQILDELAVRDGQTLFEICHRLVVRYGSAMSRQAISQHLDVLEAAGLIRTQRSGRTKLHHLDPAPLQGLADRWLGRPTEEDR